MKCIFPVENSNFCRPKANSSGFEKWKAKKEKKEKKRKEKKERKKKSSYFVTFLLPFHFPPSLFQFSFFFFSIFSFFPCLSFSGRLAEISRWKVSGGGHSAPNCYAIERPTAISNKLWQPKHITGYKHFFGFLILLGIMFINTPLSFWMFNNLFLMRAANSTGGQLPDIKNVRT